MSFFSVMLSLSTERLPVLATSEGNLPPDMPEVSDTANVRVETAERGADIAVRQGADLSHPADARLISRATQNQAGNVSSLLPECDISEFMKQPGRFESLDTDGNQFITEQELDDALKNGKYSDTEKITLRYMKNGIDYIEDASNDEWFSENDGITRQDAADFKPFQPSLDQKWLSDPLDKNQFHIWTSVLADKLGIKDNGNQEMTNVFRHTLTSAIYALKYGETPTNAAGELNEVQPKARDFFSETGDHWWKDSRADTYNNSAGFAIAKVLEERARTSGNAVTVDDVVRATYTALQQGKLITNVDTGANQYGKTLQKP